MKHSAISLFAAMAVAGVLLAPVSKADPVYKTTEVTFHEPVEIPGMVLPAGTYVMRLLDPLMDQDIVQFYDSQEKHMYKMVFAVRDFRLNPPDHTLITFEERAHGAPQAIKEWIPIGEQWGEEFVYPKVRPVVAQVAPQQLQPRPAVPAPAPIPAPPAAQPAPTPAPAAHVQPQPRPVEIAQAQPAPAPSTPAEPPKELPKTGSNLPLLALLGGAFLLAGAVLRARFV